MSADKLDRIGGIVPVNQLFCNSKTCKLDASADNWGGIVPVNKLLAIDRLDSKPREEITLGMVPRNELL